MVCGGPGAACCPRDPPVRHRLDRAIVAISVNLDLGTEVPGTLLRDYADEIDGVLLIYYVTALRAITILAYVEA